MAALAALSLVIALASFPLLPANAARPSRHLLAGGEAHIQLEGHLVGWANPENLIGAAPPDDIMRARLHVGYRNPAAVKALADAVSNPKSRTYTKYLTVEQFTARFAPSPSRFAALIAWARNAGLQVAYAATNRKLIALEGSVERYSAALHTTFGLYSVRGMRLRAPQSEPLVLTSLAAGYTLTFAGLDQWWPLRSNKHMRPPPSPKTVRPALTPDGKVAPGFSLKGCVFTSPTTYDVATVTTSDGVRKLTCGYTPQQVRGAYGIPKYLTGKGQSVAIVDAYASPFIQADLDLWSDIMGIPSTTIQFEYPPFEYNASENAPPGYDPDWAAEETLDVETVHGIAPDAKIVYLGAPSSSSPDLDSAINYVLEHKLASVISNSYGAPLFSNSGLTGNQTANIQIIEDLALQGAVLGIGMYFASGDRGDDSTTDYGSYDGYTYYDVTTPAVPNAIPYVTSVGGTTLAIGAKNNYIREYGWGETRCNVTDPASPDCSFHYGAGGGIAYNFASPAYQQLVGGPKRIYTSAGYTHARVVPDVAAFADPNTGLIIGISQQQADGSSAFGIAIYGGTSLACPAFAAMMVLKQQLKKKHYGFANPYLYSHQGMFHDILPAEPFVIVKSVIHPEIVYLATLDTSLQAYRGYDNVTGLGTPGPAFWYHSSP